MTTSTRGQTKKSRIVKPITAKQRAAADRYSAQHGPLLIYPAGAGLPKDSWWTRPQTREEFQQLAAAERPRMALSSAGRAIRLIAAKDSKAVETC